MSGRVECDRSFTRSDALAKHMRTVHETEALRPSDPVPKSHSSHAAGGGGRKKEIKHEEGEEGKDEKERWNSYYEAEDGFDTDEERLPPKELYRLLKQKQAWAEQEQEELKETLEKLSRKRREAWIKKEMLLEKVLQRELGDEEARHVSLDWV
jgi:hypothetical protein